MRLVILLNGVRYFLIRCKSTIKIWKMQEFEQENQIYFLFPALFFDVLQRKKIKITYLTRGFGESRRYRQSQYYHLSGG